MHEVKLPDTFEGMFLDDIVYLVDDFVCQNRKIIPKKQLRKWCESDDDRNSFVPTLFLEFLNKKGFVFQDGSRLIPKGIKNTKVSLLPTLIKKDLTKLKGSPNEVKHPGRAHQKSVIINPKALVTISLCTKEDCLNNNTGKCSTHPIKPRLENSIIVDCDRYSSKENRFKSKTWDQVLDTSPER